MTGLVTSSLRGAKRQSNPGRGAECNVWIASPAARNDEWAKRRVRFFANAQNDKQVRRGGMTEVGDKANRENEKRVKSAGSCLLIC